MEQSLKRRMARGVVVLAWVFVSACASISGGGGPGTRSDDYIFAVDVISTGGAVARVDVRPSPAKDGLYDGGHARIEMTKDQQGNEPPVTNIKWTSRKAFWIKFEPLKTNRKHSEGTICLHWKDGSGHVGNQEPDAWTMATADASGSFAFECELDRKGGKTYSVKYWLADKNPDTDPSATKLDPVIIVDR